MRCTHVRYDSFISQIAYCNLYVHALPRHSDELVRRRRSSSHETSDSPRRRRSSTLAPEDEAFQESFDEVKPMSQSHAFSALASRVAKLVAADEVNLNDFDPMNGD